ncbi:MAG: hypothetical protein ABR585_01790 [Gemmatimonadaceae bacterium]
MERNESEGFGSNAGGGQTSFETEFNSTSSTNSGSTGSTSGSIAEESSKGGVTNRVKSVASSVKGKASNLPSLLADGLQAGAEALRQRRTSIVETTGSAGAAVAEDSSIAAVTDSIATGMQSSADWLRDADLGKIRDGVEKQVKEHPARTLLVALGAGYLIGKALRR